MNTPEDAPVNDDEIALAVALAEARADNEVLAKQLALMTKDQKYGWDTARESDKEYKRVYAKLVEARDALQDILRLEFNYAFRLHACDIAKEALSKLDISTKLPPK